MIDFLIDLLIDCLINWLLIVGSAGRPDSERERRGLDGGHARGRGAGTQGRRKHRHDQNPWKCAKNLIEITAL